MESKSDKHEEEINRPKNNSNGVLQATYYEETISSSRWKVQVPYPTNQARSLVSPIRTLYYLSRLYTWEKPWCAPREWGVVGDGRWHYSQVSISLLETLINITHQEKVSSVASNPNVTISHVGREPKWCVSHRPTTIETQGQTYNDIKNSTQ